MLDALRRPRRGHLPVILQAEVAECALACLAMVSTFHGRAVDLAALRRQHPLSLKGASLKGLMDAAAAAGFAARPLRVDLHELPSLSTPCILHWDMQHFVVLRAATATHVDVHNPALGRRRYRLAEVSRRFTGVALELWPAPGFTFTDQRERLRLRDFWTRAPGLVGGIGQVLVLSLLLQVFALAAPFHVQLVVDEAIARHDDRLLGVLALGFLLLALFRVATSSLRSYVIMTVGAQLSLQMTSNLLAHLLRLPLAWFQRRHLGDVLSRMGSLEPVRALFGEGIVGGVVDGVMAVATLTMMCVYSPALAGIVVAALAVYALVRVGVQPLLRERTEEGLAARAREEGTLLETLRAMQCVRIFGKEAARHTLSMQRLVDVQNSAFAAGRIGIAHGAANSLLLAVENVAVVWLGAEMVLSQVLSIGMLYAFIAWKGQFSDRASALIDRAFELRMLSLHLERLADIALTAPEAQLPERRPLRERSIRRECRGSIALDGVSFRYAAAEPWVLRDVSLSLAPGEVLALVGPSGGGKSTLLKVMLGLLEPTAGEVRVDGELLSAFGIDDYRACVGAVMQDDQLFAGTIADNITFFDAEPDHAFAAECARHAGIDADIRAMPMQYLTLIGDMGSALSGGQRQRLLLARALYRRPRVLFLDEMTAHVDGEAAARIEQALRTLGITRVAVTHDARVAAAADRVLCVRGGCVEALPPPPTPAAGSAD
jgi:ATP-binding cassette subfamily B protein RaxB